MAFEGVEDCVVADSRLQGTETNTVESVGLIERASGLRVSEGGEKVCESIAF